MSEPGQADFHVFDGITYSSKLRPDTLRKIRDELMLYSGDIVIATYPKSGTTWMEEIVYSIMHGSAKSKERKEPLDTIIPFLEFGLHKPDVPSNYDKAVAMSPPRIIKTHLNVKFYKRSLETPESGPKFIVIVRNPKDTLVSYHNHHRVVGNPLGKLGWDEYFELFKQHKLSYGNMLEHHVGWWSVRDHANVLFLQYEKMLADSSKAIRQVAEFLGYSLSEEELAAVREGSKFETMQARGIAAYHESASRFNETEGGFFRKGKKGNWQSHFSGAQSKDMDELIKTIVTPTGLSYTF